MVLRDAPLLGIKLIKPKIYSDSRGFFEEIYQVDRYKSSGILTNFVQDNHSRSTKGVVRGLHYTIKRPQAQLLTVIRGAIFDVVVDVRKNSLTFGKWFGVELSDESEFRQIYMPHGFAHGFCVLSEYADIHYRVTQPYEHSDEFGIRWNDPEVGIDWPVSNPVVSDRDQAHPFLADALL